MISWIHRIKRILIYSGVLVCILMSHYGFVSSESIGELIEIGTFSALSPGAEVPSSWESLTFDNIEKYTDYHLVEDNNTTVIMAESRNSSSALVRKISIDPKAVYDEPKSMYWRTFGKSNKYR